jgi:hypothetical protein
MTTVTTPVAAALASAWDVAVTWKTPGVKGAEYIPDWVTVPPKASQTFQEIPASVDPVTCTAKARFPPVRREALVGVRTTPKGTYTDAVPTLLGSELLLAVTV